MGSGAGLLLVTKQTFNRLILIVGLLLAGDAYGATFDPTACPNGIETYYFDSGKKYASSPASACDSWASKWDGEVMSLDGPSSDSVEYQTWSCWVGQESAPDSGSYINKHSLGIYQSCSACPAGQAINPDTGQCVPITCPAGETYYGSSTATPACFDGCLLEHDLIASTPDDGSGDIITIFGTWLTTGEQCPAAAEPITDIPEDANGDHCMDVNGQNVCLADDSGPNCGEINGEQICVESVPENGCATTPNGATVCGYSAPDTDRPTNDDGTAKEPDLDVNPGNDENGTPAPGPVNYYGGSGGSGGPGGDDGSGGDGSGGGGDGSGDDGDDGEPCPEGETCDPSYNPSGPDDWYTPDNEKTFGSVLSGFSTQAGNAPFIAAGKGFFDISIAAGACPIWTADVPIIGTLTMDVQCSAFMEDLWPIVAAILLSIAAFTAFRWAFL